MPYPQPRYLGDDGETSALEGSSPWGRLMRRSERSSSSGTTPSGWDRSDSGVYE